MSGVAGASSVGTSDRSDVKRLLGIVGQLGILLALIVGLRIENAAFFGRIAPLAFGGAVVNHLLPARYRLAFFALLSMAGIWLVFGLEQGSWILGIGIVLIALCHLPVPRLARLAAVLSAAVVLVLMRADYVPAPWSNAIWPIVGSMFMFRLIIYLYDLPHLKERITWAQSFGYFFCLPNVVFPLFPVLDFSTFRRTYYDRAPAVIYQEGVDWILRGLVHLVAYRLVYQFGTLSPAEVRTGADLIMYLMANYALYLRVSGQFHMIAGLLHLFGFRLPETHRFFFLASSFSDLWRRINIYWKDFMQKVFYMPVFLPLVRRRGETFAMVASTMLVFFVTWFFHSYQWFWSLGTWLWSATDTLFWSLLGVCLIANSLLESRRGRLRTVGVPRPTVARLLGHSAQTAAMFSLMCVLWALWTSPTMRAFVDLVGGARFGARDLAVLFTVWITVGVLAAFTYRRAHAAAGKATLSRWAAASTAALLSLVPLSEVAPVQRRLSPSARSVLAKARDLDLNKRDQEQMQRGYYEKIVGVNRFNNELWKIYSLRPRNWVRLDSTGAVRLTNDDRLEELVPGFSADFHGGRLTINSAGLRDREYAVEKPANVFRIAVLGQSYVLGEGVDDDQTFENVLENRLNARDAAALGYSRIEILNFGAPAYSALQQRADLVVGRVEKWRPDLVLCVGHFRELAQIDDYFRSFLRQRGDRNLPPEVARWIDAAGLTKEMSATEAERRLAPFAVQILSETYLDMTRRIRSMGARPVFAYIPTPAVPIEAQKLTDYLATASGAGFDTMLDLRSVYGGGNEMRFVLQPWDHHPNVDGHRRVAEVLYQELQGHPGLLRRDAGESGKR